MEEVSAGDALDRVLAEEVRSLLPHPPFPQAAMDGFAVHSADTDAPPTTLRLAGEVTAGRVPQALRRGRCVRIYTGALLPEGADAVVPLEEAECESGKVRIPRRVAAGENVRPPGADFRTDARLLERGMRLNAPALALLAAAGVTRIRVTRRPRVALVTTGDEVRPPGGARRTAEIYNSAGLLARGVLQKWALCVRCAHAPDREEVLFPLLTEALKAADLVITIGGVSVGERDLVRKFAEKELDILFWRVRQRPGKPLLFARGESWLLGLPGNPGSVMACLYVHARFVLAHLEGTVPPVARRAPLAAEVRQHRERWLLLRCRWKEERLLPLPAQGSGFVRTLPQTEAYALVPPGEGALAAGSAVDWLSV